MLQSEIRIDFDDIYAVNVDEHSEDGYGILNLFTYQKVTYRAKNCCGCAKQQAL